MSTPTLQTERLILRAFTEADVGALYQIHSDREVNRFLPWFPPRTMDDALAFYRERCESAYRQQRSYHFAICLKEDPAPIGYISVGTDDSHDLGYGLRREFWRRGLVTEAGRAVIDQLKRDGVPYITATHDVNNPRSGEVMRRLGMRYQYSYEEQWQPKDIPVTFRMYQRNLDGASRVYRGYWDRYAVHFIEEGLPPPPPGRP
ncbi:MAG: GNAT family N-acetyltransferase [Oscillospiraceae bacterium]|nr:GNAT family N-acetyltransferase [Oscillospiraceae bacterium]